MDNLRFLESLNNECVDLIAIDPPFAKNDTFRSSPRLPISDAEFDEELALAARHGVPHSEGIGETQVRDIWKWDDDVHPAWKMKIQSDYPAVHSVIQAVELCASENEAAYIAYMAARLIHCRRALKPTGSIYLHCDWQANSYLRILIDAIFGSKNFRNEIVWSYPASPSNARRDFPRKHDTILRYVKTSDWTFNADDVRVPYAESSMNRIQYAANASTVMRGTDIILHEGGKIPPSVWDDIQQSYRYRAHHTGYATQKPLALYERIIKASSQPGDVVLDIFAGCATTAVAAERLGRRWLACDIAYRSWTMLKRRFYQSGMEIRGTTQATRDAMAPLMRGFAGTQQYQESFVFGPNDLAARDDEDPEPQQRLETRRRGGVQSSTWSGRIPKAEAKRLLIDRFGHVCWGCGYEPKRPNGTYDDALLEVDHIRARNAASGAPGDDEMYNLAILHRTCNGIKGNRMSLEDLRRYNAENMLLYAEGPDRLVDTFEALQFAAAAIMERGAQPVLAGAD